MAKYWDNGGFFEQPSASSLKKNSQSTVKKEKAKGKVLDPIVVSGRQIVKSWWGKAWSDNLEQYADFESRLERGKRYVRTGTVVDLKINHGRILARVQGRRKTPYKTEIRISPLSEERCQKIIQNCGRRVENLEELVDGNFPDDLKELFLGKDGLFPAPREISFSCSCPDWALMCKHVAAVLYGVGVRLDEDPLLFFELRGIDAGRFIDVTLQSKVEQMLSHVDCRSERIIQDRKIEELFGMQL
ncbi:MAG: SWIM zinc finger family protein [Lachnospiraceae bacterium]|nr:SWIM zinc finger family protein [Lachnospiraceae bacterium]